MPLDPERLRALRIEAGLTARGLQTAAGVQNPTVYRIEAGRAVAVTVETAERIADALGSRLGRRVTVDELLARPHETPEEYARAMWGRLMDFQSVQFIDCGDAWACETNDDYASGPTPFSAFRKLVGVKGGTLRISADTVPVDLASQPVGKVELCDETNYYLSAFDDAMLTRARVTAIRAAVKDLSRTQNPAKPSAPATPRGKPARRR